MGKNWQKLAKTGKNGQKWATKGKNCCKMEKITQNGQNRGQAVKTSKNS